VARWDEVSLWIERAPVCDSERVVCDGVRDGTPHIDDPHTAFEQAICVCGDVEPHPGKSCLRCLVNVHAQLGDGAVSGGAQGLGLLAKAYGNAGLGDVTVKIYEGGRHELINEIAQCRDQVTADLLGWLGKHSAE